MFEEWSGDERMAALVVLHAPKRERLFAIDVLRCKARDKAYRETEQRQEHERDLLNAEIDGLRRQRDQLRAALDVAKGTHPAVTDAEACVAAYAKAGEMTKRIECIKKVCELTGLGLKEAKDFVAARWTRVYAQ